MFDLFAARLRPCALLLILSPVISSAAFANGQHLSTDPAGIMGDHVHQEGDWMVAYRFGNMSMNGNRNGSDRLTTADVLSDFMASPTSMDMQMHMFSAMYGLTDRVSLMAMGAYIHKSMDHVTRMGMRFETETEGFGDTQLGFTYGLFGYGHALHEHPADCPMAGLAANETRHQLYLNALLSVPTGSIDERGDTPAGRNMVLPYPMQLGSGTVDPILGLTYSGRSGLIGWGAQGRATLRLYDNSESYHLGNHYQISVWGTSELNQSWQFSARLEGHWQDAVDGADPRLNPMMVQTANPDLLAGRRIDALLGLNYTPKRLEGNRFAFEIGRPIYQHLDGPQLEVDWRLTANWQWSF